MMPQHNECKKLIERYPEILRLLKWEQTELDPTFLGFLQDYSGMDAYIPADFQIVDLGCYQAVQSIYFQNHPYIGVDLIPTEVRYQGPNITHIRKDITEYINTFKENELNHTFVFCCNVPDRKTRELVKMIFPYYKVTYPGCPTYMAIPKRRKLCQKMPSARNLKSQSTF